MFKYWIPNKRPNKNFYDVLAFTYEIYLFQKIFSNPQNYNFQINCYIYENIKLIILPLC